MYCTLQGRPFMYENLSAGEVCISQNLDEDRKEYALDNVTMGVPL